MNTMTMTNASVIHQIIRNCHVVDRIGFGDDKAYDQ